jgi:hypothetical protein
MMESADTRALRSSGQQATSYLDNDLRADFVFLRFGIVVIRARRTVFTDFDVGNTLEMSGSRITTR